MEPVTKEARCLFCSLGCRCQVQLGEPPWTTAAPQDGNGLCARAFFIGNLLSHPERINLAACRSDGRLATVGLDEALDALTGRIAPGSPTAILVDGNYSAQAISAVLGLAAEAPETTAAVYLPAGDEAMLAGLEASKWAKGAPPGGKNDAVLVVGDAFATHPPIARLALDVKQAARGNQLLVVSSSRGTTAGFATQAAIVPPGGEAALLLGVAKRLNVRVPGVKADVDPPGAEAIAAGLERAKSPAIVLSQPEGTTANGHIAALAAARIAAKLKAPLLPLFTYGNALGAHRAAAEQGAASLADVVARAAGGEVKTLLLVGVDLMAAMPGPGGKVLDAVELVAAACSFPNATTARANVVIPLGLWCEEEGDAALPSGESVAVAPAAPPIGGALTVGTLVRELGSRVALDAANRAEPAAAEKPSWELAPTRQGDGMTLVASGDVLGFADGSLSSHNWWAQAARPEPAVVLNPADCKRTGAFGGKTAVVRTAGAEARLAVQCSEDVPPGVASVPMCFAATRQLFGWEIDPQAAAICCGPVEVTIGAGS